MQYVHVIIDTFSGFLVASPRAGEATKDIISHCLYAFKMLGIPKQIKTDNGPGYVSKGFSQFLQSLNIQHVTGIPYNPQGQGIIERAHLTIKTYLKKIQGGIWYPKSPQNLLNHVSFILNFLTLDASGLTAADRHWHPTTNTNYAKVHWKDVLTGQWKGPDPVIIWGRGSVCILPTDSPYPVWIPE